MRLQVGLSALRRDPYDLIIIGSGPAGLTLARKYEELATGKVLIVESEHRSNIDGNAQRLSVMDASGDLPADHYPIHNQRVFGGTSTVWRGFCAVLEILTRQFIGEDRLWEGAIAVAGPGSAGGDQP